MKEKFQKLIRFVRFVLERAGRDHLINNSASLTYTTLLSLVPLMAVGLSVLSAFPVFDKVQVEIQEYIIQNFVPAAGDAIQTYLQQFTSNVSRLTGIGIGFLVLTALMLMSRIDQSMNAIWNVRRRRKPLTGFLVYWAVLTLGPLMVGIGLIVSSYLTSLLVLGDAATVLGLKQKMLRILPFLLEVGAFSLLYLVVPNRTIRYRHALIGAVVAALMFELAKKGFAYYVVQFPTYTTLYGAMAAIPIFLIWVYASWVMVLIGAEVARCLAIYRDQASGLSERGHAFMVAYRVTGLLWQEQMLGKSMPSEAMLANMPHVSEEVLEEVLDCLSERQVIMQTHDTDWVLARDISEMTLYDLYETMAVTLPGKEYRWADRHPWDDELFSILDTVRGKLNNMMNIPLKQLYSEAAEQGDNAVLVAAGQNHNTAV